MGIDAQCVRCDDLDCGFCAKNFKKCDDNLDDLKMIVKNANGHMGQVTFTLMWRDDVDLDLWFTCNKNSNKVYWSNKADGTCDSKLDVDMRESRINYKRADGSVG